MIEIFAVYLQKKINRCIMQLCISILLIIIFLAKIGANLLFLPKIYYHPLNMPINLRVNGAIDPVYIR